MKNTRGLVLLFVCACLLALTQACPASSTKLTPYISGISGFNCGAHGGPCSSYAVHIGVKNCDSQTYALTSACVTWTVNGNPVTPTLNTNAGSIVPGDNADVMYYKTIGPQVVSVQSAAGTASISFTTTSTGLSVGSIGAPNKCQN